MACEVAAFLEHGPGAVDVVLVHSERWTEYRKAITEARKHLPLERLLGEFKESQPCAVSGSTTTLS